MTYDYSKLLFEANFLLTIQFISLEPNNIRIETGKIQFEFDVVHNFSAVN